MTIQVVCPHCGARLTPKPEWAGIAATCKSCQGRIVIPQLTSSPRSGAASVDNLPNTAADSAKHSQDMRAQSKPSANRRPMPMEKHAAPPNAHRKLTDPVRKRDLKNLLLRAGAGDQESARRLISPFVAPGEQLLMFGISAEFGIMRTYDFYFLTDRRIGDLEITPFTGNLNVEVAYLHKVDALVLSQPAFSLKLRLLLATMYIFLPGLFYLSIFGFMAAMRLPDPIAVLLGVIAAMGGVYAVAVAVNPAIKRAFLRFRKSGLWLKLTGSFVGTLIFADRDKFETLTRLTRAITDIKRQLDKVAT